jgi:hypothetical protein
MVWQNVCIILFFNNFFCLIALRKAEARIKELEGRHEKPGHDG